MRFVSVERKIIMNYKVLGGWSKVGFGMQEINIPWKNCYLHFISFYFSSWNNLEKNVDSVSTVIRNVVFD